MSLIARAVCDLSINHSINAGTDFPKVGNIKCRLASGFEGTLVALFCNYVMKSLSGGNNIPQFHEFFYMPSRRAEFKVGYDLSIGN